MNKAVANVLNRVLGDFIKDLNSDQLNISVFSGNISLENLNLNENILHLLGLPFDLQHGSVGKIHVKIPWTSLLSSSLSIEISDVYAYVTPSHPTNWKEAKEIEHIHAAKTSSLAQFEAMNAPDLGDTSSPGYFANYATTIVNNIQISINNIYVRYEDNISSTDVFAIGLSLRNLSIQTCDQSWKPHYSSDADICYKLIELKEFQCFCDFNVPVVKFRDSYTGEVNKAFKELVKDDMRGNLQHNFILMPFSSSLKIKIAIKPSLDAPQFDLQFSSDALFLDFYSGQIKLFLKFGEFMKLYSVFKAGVTKNLREQEFNEASERLYTDTYKKWKSATPESKDSKEYAKVLENIEKVTQLDQLKRVRTKAIQEMEHRKTIELKKHEIGEMQKSKEGMFSKASGYFFGPSEADKKKAEEEKKAKLDLAERELNLLIQSDPNALQFIKTTSEDEKNWIKIAFDFMIHTGGFSLLHEKSQLLVSNFTNFGISGGLKENCMLLKLGIKEFHMTEHIEKSGLYPYIFESHDFQVDFVQNPMKIKIYSGEVYMCSIFTAIMKIATIFKEAATANVDISDYMNSASGKFNEYITDGQDYLKGVISEGGESVSINLEMKLRAPKLIIPLDVHKKSAYLVVNLGKISCRTSNSIQDQVPYENYKLKLKQLESYIVWQWKDPKEVKKEDKDHLLKPVKILTVLSKASLISFDKPGFKISVNINDIILGLDGNKVKFLIDLQNLYTIQEEQSPYFFEEPDESAFYERKPIMDNLSDFKRLVPVQVSVVMQAFAFSLSDSDSCLCEIGLKDMGFSFSTDSLGNINLQIYMTNFSVTDMRENAQFKNIISNPNQNAEEASQQLRIIVSMQPLKHLNDIGVVMSELRVVASDDFAVAMMNFYIKHAYLLKVPAKTQEKKLVKSFFMIFESNARYTVCLKTIELWLDAPTPEVSPQEKELEDLSLRNKSSDSSLNAAQFCLCVTAVYTTSYNAKYVYAADNTQLSVDYNWCKEEASVTLSHFGGGLLNSEIQKSSNNSLIAPCRISIEYIFNKNVGEFANMLVNIRLESICIFIGFKDIEFFKNVAASWAKVPQLPASQASPPPKKLEEPVPEDKTVMKVRVDSDALQITVIDDTTAQSTSLLHIHFSNMDIKVLTKDNRQGVRVEILMFIDYFNKKLGAWEPVLEDWKFILKLIKEGNETTVIFKSHNELLFNLTHQLVKVLGVLQQRLGENSSVWAKSNPNDQANPEHGNIEYELRNKTGVPMKAWISIAKNKEKHWDVLDQPQVFSQRYVDKQHAHTRKKLKNTSVMSTIQAPTKLAFSFDADTRNQNSVIIEDVSMKVCTMTSAKFEFLCLVEVSVQGGKRIISFEPAIHVSNNSDQVLVLEKSMETMEILPTDPYRYLSVDWCLNMKQVRIQGKGKNFKKTTCPTLEGKPTILENSVFSLENGTDLVCDVQEYIIDKHASLTVIEFNPLFFVKNMLHSSITILNENNETIKCIEPGEEAPCAIDPERKYSLVLTDEITKNKHQTGLIILYKKKTTEYHLEDLPESSILISSAEKEFENYPGLKKFTKKINKKKIISRVLSIYSEYIIVNKTQYDLVLNDLEVPTDENRYYSPNNPSCRLKMAKFDTKASDKFNIHTIGISGMVKLTQALPKSPQHFLFGVSISQAPAPMLNSKIVTFVPRFMIWNYLEFPIAIRQYGVNDGTILEIGEKSSSNNFLPFYFDNYNESKAITMADLGEDPKNDETVWSGPFNIEDLEDLQVKFSSKPTPAESKMNAFQKGWFVPRAEKFMRYVRVFIYSQDEATIHIAFLDPKDPDFRITNNSDEDLNVRQKGCKNVYKLPKDSMISWAWDDHLAKKKRIEVISDTRTEYFSLDNIKDKKKKKFKGQTISVQADGVTRLLVINYSEQEIDTSIGALLDARKTSSVQQFGATTVSFKKASRLEGMKTIGRGEAEAGKLKKVGLFDLIKTKSILKFSMNLAKIGISIVDDDSNELFYIAIENLEIFRESESNKSGMNTKSETNDMIRFEHFQLDYMGPDNTLFPVMIFPVRRDNEVEESRALMESSQYDDQIFGDNVTPIFSENYYFFTLVIERESSIRTKKDGKVMASMDKFSNIEFLIREIQIKINEEAIYNLMKIKDFFSDFTVTPSLDSKLYLKDFKTTLPELPFDPSVFQRKAYFKDVKMRAMKFLVTFVPKSSEGKAGSEYDSGMFIFSLIKKLGGAFINVSESPFAFTEIRIEDAFKTIDNFTWVLIKKYISQGIQQFYKIFGSIDIIGNPLGLIEKLGVGVYEFISEPAKGLIRGPKSFARGVGKGVKSLVSGVIGGGFGSISKMSGSLYNVLRTTTGEVALSHDISTENIGKNMVIGFKDGFLDIAHGIFGLAVKPYLGARAAGAKGFFKGFMTGTAGFITFPFKVVLKFTNVISTTIASTSLLITSGRIHKYGRARFPRQFGAKKILDPYNLELAEAQALLKTLGKSDRYKNEKMIYYSNITLNKDQYCEPDRNIIILLTPKYFVYILDGEMHYELKTETIVHMEFHVYNRVYFLAIATHKKNFTIPSKEYSALASVYNAILCQAILPTIPDKPQYEMPKYMNKVALLNIVEITKH